MRGFRGTAILGLVVAGLIGYAVYDYRESEKKSAESAEKEKIIPLDAESVTLVNVVRPDETVSLSHEGGVWKLIAPVTDDVETEAARAYLDSIGSEKGSEIEKPQAGFNWSEYNLDAPAAKFSIKKADGTSVELSVSRLAAFDGRYFIRVGDRLYIGTSAWGGIAAKGSAQLRSKKVLRAGGDIQGIVIESGLKDKKERVVLRKGSDGGWKMEGADFAVSSAAVEKYVDQLKNLRALDYLATPGKIESPAIRLTLQFAKAEPKLDDFTLVLAGEKEGSVLASSTAVKEAFKLSQYDAGQVGKGKFDFRDGHEPFRLNVSDIHEIRIESKTAGKRVIKKEGTGWKATDLKEGEELASENLEQMLTQMGSLEAKSFYKQGTPIGETVERVEFIDTAGKLLLGISSGAEVLPTKGQDQDSALRYVKSSLTKDVLGVLSSSLSAIPFATVVRNKVAPQVDSSKQR